MQFHSEFAEMSGGAAIWLRKEGFLDTQANLCHQLSVFKRIVSDFVNTENKRDNKKQLFGERNGFSLIWHGD